MNMTRGMLPYRLGLPVAQIESSGRTKATFDVLLWTEELLYKGFQDLESIQLLREYLSTIPSPKARINLWLPESMTKTQTLLKAEGITVSPISIQKPDDETLKLFGDGAPTGMADAAATGRACDADMVVTETFEWFPYFFEFEKQNTQLGNPGVLLRQCEIFARGHDITWSFKWPMADSPWSSFYFFAEQPALAPSMTFLELCQKKGANAESKELGRSLVYNRMPNIFFTRDRLLFLDQQLKVAKRTGWQRQKFQFEITYFLNFYYVLIYGAFDHIAVLLNALLNLGIPERDVTAKNNAFLTALQGKSKELHGLFTSDEVVNFLDRISSLRHQTAHRGHIAPALVYEKPDKEPTVEELDEEIRKKGLDANLRWFPEGAVRDAFREQIRFTVKLSKYKLVLEDVVFVEGKKTKGFINPLNDTEYNYDRFYRFLGNVLQSCSKLL
jgi:hypothetical protein